MKAYMHDSLPDADFMRLLSIEPFQDNQDDIRCSMQTVPMGSDIAYVALSYSCGMDIDGDASICERIIVDGRILGVAKNLFQGLWRIFGGFGSGKQMIPIWVDAVCIHQHNIEERSAQVARMGEIYANATQVFVWLGEGDDRDDNARIASMFDCLRKPRHQHYNEHTITTREGKLAKLCLAHAGIAASFAMNALRTSSTKPAPDDFPKSLPRCVQTLFDIGDLAIAANELQRLLTSFASKRYWGRRWIVQELFHADHNEVYIVWADHVLSVRNLQTALFRIGGRFAWHNVGDMFDCDLDLESKDDTAVAADKVKRVLQLRSWASAYTVRGNFLARILENSNGYDCSNPRDRLYALISMDPSTELQPDYSLTPENVYTSFCADLIKDDVYLPGMLYSAAEQKTQGKYYDTITESLPSWCLDLREDFKLPPRQITLGPCTVDHQGRLKCTALILGTLSCNKAFVVSETGSMDDPSTYLYDIEYAYSKKSRAADLICVFQNVDTTNFAGMMPAIILQATRHNYTQHCIVGLCLLRVRECPQGHILREVSIC